MNERARLQRADVCDSCRLLQDLFRSGDHFAHRRGARAAEDRIGGARRFALPIPLEVSGDVAHDRTDRHHVEIDERHCLVRIEVFVADVAAADDRNLAVDRERLVVHAAVEAREVGEVLQRTPATQPERVEQPHLDVRVRRERRQECVETGGVVVVEQQPDAHAAIGRAAHRREQQRAGNVVAPDVVLEIERALRGIREQHAGSERVAPVAQLDDARLPRMQPRARRYRTTQAGLGSRRRLGEGFEHRGQNALESRILASGA